MSLVPKLNYANLRGKSKDSENSQRKIENASSDLFSQMNQDNLKYIQNQIKQKSKKASTNNVIRKSQQQEKIVEIPIIYSQKIQQKDPSYQETQRQIISPLILAGNLKVLKTDGESVRYQKSNDEVLQKASQEAQTHKLSYYDLVSQAKSKRVSSIQGYQQQNQFNMNKEQGQFLTFLSGYIDDLKSKDQSKKSHKNAKSKPKQFEKVKSISLSSISETEILKEGLAKQKMRNIYLSKQIQQHRIEQQNFKKRIISLQEFVTKLADEIQQIKYQLPRKPILEKTHLQNLNIYTHHHPDYNRPSHRKNNTTFTFLANQQNKPNYIYNDNDRNKNRANHNIMHQQDFIGQRNSRKVFDQEINSLQKQYQLFKQTGQFKVRGRIHQQY